MEHVLLGDRVLIKPETETVSSGGIIIPDSGKARPKKGVVMIVGPGKDGIEMTVKKDDKVLFGEYSGIEIELDDKEKYLIMKEDDIFMILKNK